MKRKSSNPLHPYRKLPVDERSMKEGIMNTSWSCTQKAYRFIFPIGKECRRVGCDGTHTLLCKGCEHATDKRLAV
ncbi:MAG: hypothetical protein HFG82_09115 [Dorea sp.]|nr:hypothetical protein [Dorea sp.]